MSPPKSPYSDQLDRIENAIIGNGREGLLGRTARIEERLNTVDDLVEEAKKTAETEISELKKLMHQLEINVIELGGALKTHIGTDHLSVLMRKKQFWAVIVVLFITLHIIATYIPNLWDAIMMLVGLPKLVIPLN